VTEPLRVLTGEVGVGKSYIGERCFQDAVRDAMSDPTARVPLYSRVSDVNVGLNEWVEKHARGIGDPRTFGAFLVLDGADEPGSRSVALLEQARVLVNAFPNTQVVITARPLPQFTHAQATERRQVNELTDQEAMTLIERVAGEPITQGHFFGLDKTLRDALHLPLFALIYAGIQASDASARIRSRTDLVRTLVTHVLRNREDLRPSLETIALTTLRSGRAVALPSEMGDFAELQRALKTALLVEEGGGVRFGLAVLQEWFAAQYLKRDLARMPELLADGADRYRLRYAIAIALTELPPASAADQFEWLVREDPAFAATLIREVVPNRWPSESPALKRSALEYGQELHRATLTWSRVLGRMAPALLHVDATGKPLTLSVGVDDTRFIWAVTQTTAPEVRELGEGELGRVEYPVWGSRRLEDRNGWEWAFVLDDLQRRLRDCLQVGWFTVLGCEPYEREMSWHLASELLGRGSLNSRPIPIASLSDFLPMLSQGSLFRTRRALIPCGPLIDALARARSAGQEDLFPPWPTPDLDLTRGRFVWGPYSPHRLLERTRAVYGGAIAIYARLATQHFAVFAPGLWLFRTLPARLQGVLDPGAPDNFQGAPVLHYQFVPQPVGAPTEVRIELGGDPKAIPPDSLDGSAREYRRVRSDVPWLDARSTASALRIFDSTAASRLAYEWLADDLSQTGMLDPMRITPDW